MVPLTQTADLDYMDVGRRGPLDCECKLQVNVFMRQVTSNKYEIRYDISVRVQT